jgi:hypothetical protein
MVTLTLLRITSARVDLTFLLADVEIVGTYNSLTRTA